MALTIVIGFLWVLVNGNIEPGSNYGYAALYFNSVAECENANRAWNEQNKTVPVALPSGEVKNVDFLTTCTELQAPTKP